MTVPDSELWHIAASVASAAISAVVAFIAWTAKSTLGRIDKKLDEHDHRIVALEVTSGRLEERLVREAHARK